MDGRTARSERTKEAILIATRDAMRAGIFRPTVTEIAKASGFSIRSVFQHFGTAEGLYRVALDESTAGRIFTQIVEDAGFGLPEDEQHRIVMAAVYGRIIPE